MNTKRNPRSFIFILHFDIFHIPRSYQSHDLCKAPAVDRPFVLSVVLGCVQFDTILDPVSFQARIHVAADLLSLHAIVEGRFLEAC